ncbi:MAG: TrkA C-terminal domain-containing protein [Clostridia bacterium]|nr:TrkA C-terminal domain-containing protein [Clostridia bacterium]MBR6109805.1 TrkA C-terminal domain-containing protein [Clostridia bacterium]
MNIYVAASLFALLILVYWVISEIFTILFRFVGLPEEKARFQVTSILTGTGFTTRESEMVLSTKPRRRLARILMLFGYVFNITVVSAFINVFLSLSSAQFGNYFLGALIPFAAVALVFGLSRIRAVRRFFDRVISKAAGNITGHANDNAILLIDHIGKGTIAQVTLNQVPDYLVGVDLANSGLKEKRDILVMLVEHKDAKIDVPTAHTVFEKGDKLTVFGDYKTICKTFHAREYFA